MNQKLMNLLLQQYDIENVIDNLGLTPLSDPSSMIKFVLYSDHTGYISHIRYDNEGNRYTKVLCEL